MCFYGGESDSESNSIFVMNSIMSDLVDLNTAQEMEIEWEIESAVDENGSI